MRLAGDLYQPKGLSATDKLPGLLLIPGWGESDGPITANEPLTPTAESDEQSLSAQHIRKVVNPISMSDNLGVWGTSMGGDAAT